MTSMQAIMQELTKRFQARITALDVAEGQADYPICRERRLVRRLIVFMLISLSIVVSTAWYTNELTYYWWKQTARRNEVEGITFRNEPVYLRIEFRVETIRRLDGMLFDKLPRPFASLIHVFLYALEEYCLLYDGARFAVTVTLINVTLYLMTWSPRGEYFISRYLLHSGLSGRTYTVFTTLFVHRMWWHLLINMVVFWLTLPGLLWLSKNNDGTMMWNFTAPQLLAFYTIAGGLGYFIPTLYVQIFHRKHVDKLPPKATTLGILPVEIPVGFRVCLGASPAMYAIWVLQMLADEEAATVGPITLRLRDLIIPSLLFECGMFLLIPIGTPHHITGALFGVLYFFCRDDFQTGWDWTRVLVGNRHTIFNKRLTDSMLPDGTMAPLYNPNLMEAPLPRW